MPTATHITVKELVDAANAVHDAAKARLHRPSYMARDKLTISGSL